MNDAKSVERTLSLILDELRAICDMQRELTILVRKSAENGLECAEYRKIFDDNMGNPVEQLDDLFDTQIHDLLREISK